MSNQYPTFQATNFSQTENPSFYCPDNSVMEDYDHQYYNHHNDADFKRSPNDYLAFSDEDGTSSFGACVSQAMVVSKEIVTSTESSVNSGDGMPGRSSSSMQIKCKNGLKKVKSDEGSRVAFRTKTELEIMDDGYKWRKYGKKKVKNSPNPRNYYKCSTGGCGVKKRIERDREDSSYVITTYEGIHTHEIPSLVYNSLPRNDLWTLQANSQFPSS